MRRTTTTATATALLLPLLVGTAASPALAADSGDVTITNTETVQARLSPTGAFQGARVYEQLALTGHGTATVANPVSTRSLRNLDGFGGFTVVDGTLVSTLAVDGERRERSVSDYDKDLPLTVEITYTLDGETVQPGAVVGRSGTLGVHYKVTNTTGKTQDVTYDDGTGTMATASAETVIPMIGQLVTVLPSTFTDVRSDEAGMAGDGRGGTRMQFQMTLFPPIGSATAEFGYTAEVSHAVVPKATLTSMPVSPLDYPSFQGGAASYQAGAQKGVDLTGAGLQLDDSVLRLHDGSAQLLAGLLQLRDGASTLSTGLNDTAAPGATELAAGLNDKALPGINQLAAGLNGAAIPGSAQLAAGLNGAAIPGSAQLAAGLNGEAIPGAGRLAAALNSRIAPGADQVASGLRSAAPGAAALALGAQQLDAGLAEVLTKAPALIGGLATVDAGLADVEAGLATIYGGVDAMATAAPALHAGLQQLTTSTGTLADGLEKLRAGVTAAATSGTTLSQTAVGLGASLDADIAGLQAMSGAVDVGSRTAFTDALTSLSAKVDSLADLDKPSIAAGNASLAANLAAAASGLAAAECGVSGARAICPKDANGKVVPGVLEALAAIDTGVVSLIGGLDGVRAGLGDADDTQADGTVRGGIHSLQAGVTVLNEGGGSLGTGLGHLGAGAHQLNTGLGALSPGLTALAGGSTTLAAGVREAADGSSTLATKLQKAGTGSSELATKLQAAGTGSQELADKLTAAGAGSSEIAAGIARAAAGSDELADGIGRAADGSTQLSDGLVTATEGAPQIVDGTQQLSDEGTSQVVVSGQSTAEDFGVKYAVLSAGAERAQTEGMAYGAPDGAAGSTAYSLEIAGVDGTGVSAVGRLILAIVLFAGGVGLATLVRRRIV